MERKRELTKILLAESFKELLIKGSFDKITIKMITDQAGVIRPTFYNYFQDKYEVMEWLLETEVFQHIREMTEDGMEREAIYLLFRKMEKDRIYYQKAFEATGQNGFEEILEKKIRQLIEEMVGRHKIKLEKLQGIKDKKIFLSSIRLPL
ncbi:MAG: TetR family transcriptional regulator [Coprococcus sp.]